MVMVISAEVDEASEGLDKWRRRRTMFGIYFHDLMKSIKVSCLHSCMLYQDVVRNKCYIAAVRPRREGAAGLVVHTTPRNVQARCLFCLHTHRVSIEDTRL